MRRTSFVFFLTLALVLTIRSQAANEADKKRCAAYAQRAVQQYQLMKSNQQCLQNTDPVNWQDSYDNHFNACLVFPAKMAELADTSRQNHLIACGAISADGSPTTPPQTGAPQPSAATAPPAAPLPSAGGQAPLATPSNPSANTAPPAKAATQAVPAAKPTGITKPNTQDHALTPGG